MNSIENCLSKNSGKILLLLLMVVVMILRRPDIMTHAQPWAEDGRIWIQQIYNDGFWQSVIYPQNGYYQTIAKLIYSVSLIFGLSSAPLIAMFLSLGVRLLFIVFILSERFKYIDVKYRLAFIIYFVFMPNISEGYINATNVQWYFAIYMIAYLVAEPSKKSFWKLHDVTLILISSLSGPFVVFLSIPYFIKRVKESSCLFGLFKSLKFEDVIFAVCFIIQFTAIILSQSNTRSPAPLGASLGLLSDIFYYKIVLGSFVDHTTTAGVKNSIIGRVASIFCLLYFIYLLITSSWRFTVLMLSIFIIIGFGLAKPMMSLDRSQWDFFLLPVGDRYFLIPQLGFFCLILNAISRIKNIGHIVFYVFSLLCVVAYIYCYSIEPLPDINYKNQIAEFEKLQKGESADIHIYPPGWIMNLIKK